MDRFDVAVIGAGPEGLVATITLARAGLRVLLLEKASEPGGRAVTCEFHPGFRASLYADELPAVPDRLYRSLELARHGAILAPSPASVCISNEGTSVFFADEARNLRAVPAAARAGLLKFQREIEVLQRAIDRRAGAISPQRRRLFGLRKTSDPPAPWPAVGWGNASLDEMLCARFCDSQLRLHLAADAVSGRAVSPFLAGTALHALAPGIGRSGQPASGLGRLGTALARIARSAGVTILCDAEVTGIQMRRGRAVVLSVAGHAEIQAGAFLSALDLKRTMLDLIRWSQLPNALVKRVERFRMAGQRARVLFALDAPPSFPFAKLAPDAALGPIHLADSMEALSSAHDFWRAGVLPESTLVSLRVPSFADPLLAPIGKAVMTATISSVPAQLFDGGWTAGKRDKVAALALAAAERAMPGVTSLVRAHHICVGSDIETALGATGGDFDGGELAPDQALSFRPFGGAEWQDGRTPVGALYLGGASSAASPFLLGVSGERAALAMLADFRAGHLR